METIHMVMKMMKHIHSMEVKVESMRQMLARRPEFTIYNAFKALDKEDKGFITNEEFREMLEDYGMFVTSKDLQGLMDRYEVNYKGSGKVTYTDFLREMSPQSVMQY
jgi:Ca2+-binding EF-hand superfamily protein